MLGREYPIVQYRDGRVELVGLKLGTKRIHLLKQQGSFMVLSVDGVHSGGGNKRSFKQPPALLFVVLTTPWRTIGGPLHEREATGTVALDLDTGRGYKDKHIIPAHLTKKVADLRPRTVHRLEDFERAQS